MPRSVDDSVALRRERGPISGQVASPAGFSANHFEMPGISSSNPAELLKLRIPARSLDRFSKLCLTPPGIRRKDPLGALIHVLSISTLIVPSMTYQTWSSSLECVSGPLVFGSNHHSETEYARPVSALSALKTAAIRPMG